MPKKKTNTKKLQCKKCQRWFGNKGSYTKHVNAVHLQPAIIPPERSLTIIERKEMMKELITLCGDHETALFFLEWMGNGRNAAQAYLTLNPHVADKSAKVLGSRMLSRINLTDILTTYNLGYDRYLTQLDEGIGAMKGTTITRELKNGDKIIVDNKQADHKIRRLYHEALGEVLGFEKRKSMIIENTFNFEKLADTLIVARRERGLEV